MEGNSEIPGDPKERQAEENEAAIETQGEEAEHNSNTPGVKESNADQRSYAYPAKEDEQGLNSAGAD